VSHLEPGIALAEVVLRCTDLDAAVAGLEPLGFRLDTILPADAPTIAVVSGHGVRLRLVRGESNEAVLRLVHRGPAPDIEGLRAAGLAIELVDGERALDAPLRPSFVVTRNERGAWHAGRAGMLYRDLLPDRQGGRFVASHIRIPDGGPVPDYVHFHAVRFQLIYCRAGWVRLVYEDQGPPFVLETGDCVIQPPRIRHRVLEASPGLEVVELGAPAVHATHREHAITLPTSAVRHERTWEEQRFVWSRANGAPYEPRSLGVAEATAGVASARVVGTGLPGRSVHDAELFFGFVLRGGLTVRCGGRSERLGPDDAFAIPRGEPFELGEATADLAWLEVRLPAH
jgi:mannose-6-phosphate isomerase-like protein (cupin superfamily)